MTARREVQWRPAALAGGGLGGLAALTPGAVPRSPAVSAGAVTIGVLLGMAVGAGLAIGTGRSLRPPRAVAAVGLVAGLVLVAASVWWQQRLRSAMGMAPVSPQWVAATVGAGVLAAAAVTLIPGRSWAVLAVTLGVLLSTGTVPGTAHAGADPGGHGHALLDYGALADAPDTVGRARIAVQRWADHGGLDRRAVVLAVPTGSGWVDGAALDGFADRFSGSVRAVAVQYANVPSWQAWLTDSGRAGKSATVLLRELTTVLARRPADQRPALYLYGQSLGATGAAQALRWAREHRTPIDGTVLAGMPGGGRSGSDCDAPVMLANVSDPVPVLRPSLLWRPPEPAEPSPARRSSPQPPWLPGLSLLARGLDLLDALTVPVGHGHRYGREQGWAAPDPAECARQVPAAR